MTTPSLDNSLDYEEFAVALREATKTVGLTLEPDHVERMFHHYLLMVAANRRFNLTRITAPAEAAVKHYADSLTLLADPRIAGRGDLAVLDVGTGAGLPAVPLAIMRGDWRVTAIDGTAKKAHFVAEAAAALVLPNLQARHARGADLARRPTELFDLLLMRAVGKLAAGLRELHKLIKPAGLIVFYKTAALEEKELLAARQLAAKIGLRELAPFEVVIPSPNGPLPRRLVPFTRPCPTADSAGCPAALSNSV